jgi:hypothetical protein
VIESWENINESFKKNKSGVELNVKRKCIVFFSSSDGCTVEISNQHCMIFPYTNAEYYSFRFEVETIT